MINLLFSLILSLFVFLLSIKTALMFKPLYYFDMACLGISKNTPLAESQIKETYSYIVKYLSSYDSSPFNLAYLACSPEGRIHFEEVRSIFNAVTSLMILLIPLLMSCALFIWHEKDYRMLKYASIELLYLPLLLFMPFLINFDGSFTLFHKLMFSNDYWLFDPEKDPVINILPQEFFFHCVLLISCIMLVFSLSCFLLYKSLKHSR